MPRRAHQCRSRDDRGDDQQNDETETVGSAHIGEGDDLGADGRKIYVGGGADELEGNQWPDKGDHAAQRTGELGAKRFPLK